MSRCTNAKLYDNGKVAEQYTRKGCKEISVASSLSISVRLHSGVASALSGSETSLSNGLKSGSLKIDNWSWFGLSCFDSLRYHWQIVIKGGALSSTYLEILTLVEAFIRRVALSRGALFRGNTIYICKNLILLFSEQKYQGFAGFS